MGYETILYERCGTVALITLNRSARMNAWTARLRDEFLDAVATANCLTRPWRWLAPSPKIRHGNCKRSSSY